MLKIDPISFLASLENSVEATIFRRGLGYYQSNLVHSVRILNDANARADLNYIRVSGTVRGTQAYKTVIGIRDSIVADYECSCPYHTDHYNNEPCKHVVALGLTLTDRVKYGELDLPKISEPTGEAEEDMRRKLISAGVDVANLSPEVFAGIMSASLSKRETPKFDALQIENPRGLKALREKIKSESSPSPKPPEPFEKRYYLCLKTYGDEIHSIRLEEKVIRKDWSRYGMFNVDLEDVKNEKDLSSEQSEMISLLIEDREKSYEERRKNPIDAVRFFSLARQIGLGIEYHGGYSSAQKISWAEPEKISATLAIKEKSSYHGNHDYKIIELTLSDESSRNISAVMSGKGGLVVFKRKTIEIHTIQTALAKIIARAIKSNSYDGYRSFNYDKSLSHIKRTVFLDSEYEYINEIIDMCKNDIDCDIQTENAYTIVRHKAQPVIIVDYVASDKTLSVQPSVDYGGDTLPICDIMRYINTSYNRGVERRQEPAFGDTDVVRIDRSTIHIAKVAEKIEHALFNLGLKKSETLGIKRIGRLTARGDKQISNCAEVYLPEIKKLGYEMRYPHDMLDISDADFKADFDIDFNAEKDWLAFDMEMYCGEDRVQLEDIEACIKSGTNLLKMADGRILRIQNPEAMKRIMEMLIHFRKNDAGKFEGRTYNAPELDAIAVGSPHYNAQVSASFKAFIKEAKDGKMVKTVRIPKQFSSVLRDYQIHGVQWLHFLHHYHFAGILADDMGLGKTLQALAILSIHAKDDKPSLIIAPKTLLHNWEHEVSIFAPHLKVKIIDGTQAEREGYIKDAKKYDLIVTSYPALQKDIEVYEKYKHTFNYCVIDEAQYIKNPRTKNAHTVRRVACDYRLALTGTPLENGVEEIWSSFDFLMPGFLGHHSHFQKNIGNPIMKQSDSSALARLKTKVQCFMLRRTKEEVLKELPPKIEQVIECDLSDEQNILYQDVLKRVQKDISEQVGKKGFAGSQIHILAGLTRLRQICNHPALVLPEKKRGTYPSAKLDACLNIIEEMKLENRKVLVFSQFTKMLDILAKELDERKIKHSYLSGKTKDRKETVRGFIDDPKKTVFLISTKAGGVGLNLTVADAVVIFDPWWNPQVERQAVDRTHRIGQHKTVNVYRLRTKGTIEEKIATLQERKQSLFNALVGDSKDLFKKLTWDDVKSLLSI